LKDTSKLDYIASGCSYLRLHAPRIEVDENMEVVRRGFEFVQGKNNHNFGVLFNGFTEPIFGPRFEKYRPFLYDIHADSGGLQLVTQGKTITPEIKDEVYRRQANWSDMGMCFDEIPIGMTGATSGRNDTTNRWFKADEMEAYARATGKNIKRQIEVFLEEKSKCKPILIAQGNCYDTYMKWVEYVVDEIPHDHIKYIGGVAMGAAALGTGPLEDISRAFIFTQLPINLSHNHLHILGVGSIRRLLPYLLLKQNGSYDGVSVSYDSTTHTSGVELGLFFDTDKGNIKFDRRLSPTYDYLFDQVKEVFPELDQYSVQDFHKVMNSGFTTYTEELGLSEFLHFKMRTGFTMKSIFNFTRAVDKTMKSYDSIIKEAGKHKMAQPLIALNSVSTEADFKAWEREWSRHIKSNRVSDVAPASLEGFF
jgi:hypothetical protein